MKLFIDADGCPVIDQTLAAARKHNLPCVMIADTAHSFSSKMSESGSTSPNITFITVEKGADSADFKLVNLIGSGDIVVTQDYGLAAMCLARQAAVLNQNGLIFDAHNIDQLLLSRHMAAKARRAGSHLKGPKKRTRDLDIAFEAALEKLIREKTEQEG